MRKRRILVAIGVVVLLTLWFVLGYEHRNVPSPPTVTFVSAEPSGMVDESGTELLLVTFTINNTNRLERSNQYNNILWVKDPAKSTQARVQNRWRTMPPASAKSTTFALVEGQGTSSGLFAPPGTDSCRVWLQYTSHRISYPLTLKGISLSIVAKLPVSMRSQISSKFWRWAGFPKTGPDPNWKEICVELSIPGGKEQP